MSSILLTSNGFFTEEIKTQFKSLLSLSQTYRVAIITTAATNKERHPFAIKAKQDFYQMGILNVDFFDVETEKCSELNHYNIIYICGGNPFYLLYHMRNSGAGALLKNMAINDNIIIVGVSAGAVILGEHIEHVNVFTPQMNNVYLTDLQALSISKATIFPHYDRDDIFPDQNGRTIEERLSSFEARTKKTITRLKDTDYAIDLHHRKW